MTHLIGEIRALEATPDPELRSMILERLGNALSAEELIELVRGRCGETVCVEELLVYSGDEGQHYTGASPLALGDPAYEERKLEAGEITVGMRHPSHKHTLSNHRRSGTKKRSGPV